jgi:hypothetical protein
MTRRILAIAIIFVAFAVLYLLFAGSAVVVDETGDVESAAIVSGSSRQPLTRLWSGYFYAIPKLEGAIEVRCRSGSRSSWGYVTGHMDTKIRVVERNCRKVVDA